MHTIHRIAVLTLLVGVFVWVMAAVLDMLAGVPGTFWELLLAGRLSVRLLAVGGVAALGTAVRLLEAHRLSHQAQMEKTRHLLSSIVDNSNDAIIGQALDGTILTWNKGAEKIYGYTAEEAVGQPIGILAPGDRTDELPYILQRVREGERVAEYETTRIRKDGTRIYVSLTTSPITDAGGGVAGASTIARDITEQKWTEEVLRHTKQMQQAILDAIPDLLLRINADGTLLDVIMPVDFDLWVPLHELLGQNVHKVLEDSTRRQSKDIQLLFRFLKQAQRTEGVQFFEYPVSIQGVTHHYEVRAVNSGAGEVLAIVRDITERKQAEEALKESEARYSSLFHNNHAPMLLIDPENADIIDANPPACAFYGYDYETLIQMKISAINQLSDEEVYQEMQRAETAQRQYFNFRHQLASGEIRDVEVYSGPIKVHGKHLLYSIVHDITERRQAAAEIRRRNQELAVLLNVSQTLASRLEPEDLFNVLVYAVTDALVDADTASLWLYDETKNMLAPCAWAGCPDWCLDNLAVSPDNALVGRIYHTVQPLLANNLEPNGSDQACPGCCEARAAIGVPLLVEAQSVGAIFATNLNRPQAFDTRDLHLLQSLAGQAGIALQNAWLFADVRAGRERLQALSRKLVEVQETERRHIARELHDEIGQTLTGLSLALEMSARQPEKSGMEPPALAEAQAMVNDLMNRVRELSLNLRPSMLDDLGLLPTLLWHFERYTHQTRIQVHFKHSALMDRFPSSIETAIYRIVQEALTNAARYAGVESVTVRLWATPDVLGVQVEDAGAGFDPEAALAMGCTGGLPGMRERAALLDGYLEIDSAPGKGAQITAELPLYYKESKVK